MLRAPAILLLLTLVLVTAACGSSTNTYRTRLAKVQRSYEPKLKPLQTQLVTAIGDRRTADAADLAGRTASLLSSCADSVAAIDPPSKLRPRAATLVGSYRKLVASLQKLKLALTVDDAAPINAAISSYNAARLEAASAVAALNAG